MQIDFELIKQIHSRIGGKIIAFNKRRLIGIEKILINDLNDMIQNTEIHIQSLNLVPSP